MSDPLSHADLLRGVYESERIPEGDLTEEPAPDFGYNVLNLHKSLYSPVIDKAFLQEDGQRPEWPDDKEFAVCLTHDMDHVSAHDPRQHLRGGFRRAQARVSAGKDARSKVTGALKGVAGGCLRATRDLVRPGRDPLHRYEAWLEAEAAVDATSTFFVPPDRPAKPHETNPAYRYDDEIVFDGERQTVAEMLRQMDERGFEIGLHPTWSTFDDADALSLEKTQLECALEKQIRSVRQHYLHYDVRVTPRVHQQAGFEFDSTLGFNGNVGFRFGTSYPWSLYDLRANEWLDILEVPLAVQEGALLSRLALDTDIAFEYVERLCAEVKAVGGVLTLLWHPSRVADDPSLKLYRRILKYLSEEGAWFGTVAEIGDAWLNSAQPAGWPEAVH